MPVWTNRCIITHEVRGAFVLVMSCLRLRSLLRSELFSKVYETMIVDNEGKLQHCDNRRRPEASALGRTLVRSSASIISRYGIRSRGAGVTAADLHA